MSSILGNTSGPFAASSIAALGRVIDGGSSLVEDRIAASDGLRIGLDYLYRDPIGSAYARGLERSLAGSWLAEDLVAGNHALTSILGPNPALG